LSILVKIKEHLKYLYMCHAYIWGRIKMKTCGTPFIFQKLFMKMAM